MHFTLEGQALIRSYFETSGHAVRYALDGTAGNGFDTQFLAELVGQEGIVIAIDIQPDAIAIAKHKLEQQGLANPVRWHCACHSTLDRILEQEDVPSLDVAMFNLGYLPLGDKSIITTKATTIVALEKTYSRLASGGMLSLLSYPGHTGGSEEHQAVCQWVDSLSDVSNSTRFTDESNPKSPVLWLIVSK